MSTALTVQEQGGALAHQSSIGDIIDKLASSPTLTRESVEVVERLVALQERREEQDRKREFAGSLHAIQSARLRVHKSKAAKNSRYAPLEDIDKVLAPELEKHGLVVSFDCPHVTESGLMLMELVIYHRNGYSEKRGLPMPVDDIGTNREGKALRPKIQDHGSTVSYSRRQLLKMTFNVVETDEDDDGNGGELLNPITPEQADTIKAKCEEYGFTADDRRRVGLFAARLQNKKAISSLAEVRRCDYAAVLGIIEEMKR